MAISNSDMTAIKLVLIKTFWQNSGETMVRVVLIGAIAILISIEKYCACVMQLLNSTNGIIVQSHITPSPLHPSSSRNETNELMFNVYDCAQ